MITGIHCSPHGSPPFSAITCFPFDVETAQFIDSMGVCICITVTVTDIKVTIPSRIFTNLIVHQTFLSRWLLILKCTATCTVVYTLYPPFMITSMFIAIQLDRECYFMELSIQCADSWLTVIYGIEGEFSDCFPVSCAIVSLTMLI